MNRSLEEEKKALLERMHASRAHDRYALTGEDEHRHVGHAHAFPRSHTFKFLTRHPYSVALAAAATSAVRALK